MWCEKPSVRYCDAVIGFEAVDAIRDKAGNVVGLLAGSDTMWTCDAPMCAEHTRQVGHICGKDPDSIDHCPYHIEHEEHSMKKLVMFEHEAETIRRKVHAGIRRSRMLKEAHDCN